uniref:Uncharacterized protein n=1 Tax=viral metagenome TaxID=1070528 RepID=A0A6M3XX85_9ZZZZ
MASNKQSVSQNIEYQRREREQAQLRRKGRGRKHGFVLSPYLINHARIFGETDIFKNLECRK